MIIRAQTNVVRLTVTGPAEPAADRRPGRARRDRQRRRDVHVQLDGVHGRPVQLLQAGLRDRRPRARLRPTRTEARYWAVPPARATRRSDRSPSRRATTRSASRPSAIRAAAYAYGQTTVLHLVVPAPTPTPSPRLLRPRAQPNPGRRTTRVGAGPRSAPATRGCSGSRRAAPPLAAGRARSSGRTTKPRPGRPPTTTASRRAPT